jgi:hypothetical protein
MVEPLPFSQLLPRLSANVPLIPSLRTIHRRVSWPPTRLRYVLWPASPLFSIRSSCAVPAPARQAPSVGTRQLLSSPLAGRAVLSKASSPRRCQVQQSVVAFPHFPSPRKAPGADKWQDGAGLRTGRSMEAALTRAFLVEGPTTRWIDYASGFQQPTSIRKTVIPKG